MKKAISRAELFQDHYSDVYGDRWPILRAALLDPPTHQSIGMDEGLLEPYFLDSASLEAASLLGVTPGMIVLDMCAAPGGKTLLLTRALQGNGRIVANDRSATRRSRLQRVIAAHLPEEDRALVTITSHDATRWGLFEQNVYDRILLDAPCSSERHVLQSPSHLAQWSRHRTTQLAIQQFAMLAAALEAVKPGGRIVYSTCSISPCENDEVIDKLYDRREGRFVCLRSVMSGAEPTRHGSIILPDSSGGKGPMYASLVEKVR